MLLTDHVTTFPRDNCHMIQRILSLLMWNNEKTWRSPWRAVITTPIITSQHGIEETPHIFTSFLNRLSKKTEDPSQNSVISVLTTYSLFEASFRSELLYLLYPFKRTIVRKKRMLLLMNEMFPLVTFTTVFIVFMLSILSS